jgi:hypothetical protein
VTWPDVDHKQIQFRRGIKHLDFQKHQQNKKKQMSSYDEVSNFKVNAASMKPAKVKKFFKSLATSTAAMWIQHREDIKRTSAPPVSGKGRGKGGKSLKDLLHKTFGQTGCRTGSACLRYIFEYYIRHTDGDPEVYAVPVMAAINSILPLLYPAASQSGSYKTQVSYYSTTIQKALGQAFAMKHALVLQFAGGESSLEARLAFKSKAQRAAALQRAHNLTNLIPVPELDIMKAFWTCKVSDQPVDMHILSQLMSFSRKSEILNPEVSRYCDFAKTGYIHQLGTAKERGQKDEPELADSAEDQKEEEREERKDECGDPIPESFYTRTQVIKPILQIPSVEDDWDGIKGVFSVEDLLAVIKKLRMALAADREGLTDKKIAKMLDDELPARIQQLFPTSAAFVKADPGRPNNLNSHFLRKVGLNYAFLQQTSQKKVRFAGFAAQFGGWSTASGLDTANSYADIHIERLPANIVALEDTAMKQAEILVSMVKECKDTAAVLLGAGDDSDIEDGGDVRARIRHRRKLKRSFIDLTTDDNQVRLPFHKRRRDGSSVARAQEALRLLAVVGVPTGNGILRDLGYGGAAAKAAVAAGPSAAPDAAGV